jgi:hypothetical protein
VELRGFEPLTPSMRTERIGARTCLSLVSGQVTAMYEPEFTDAEHR